MVTITYVDVHFPGIAVQFSSVSLSSLVSMIRYCAGLRVARVQAIAVTETQEALKMSSLLSRCNNITYPQTRTTFRKRSRVRNIRVPGLGTRKRRASRRQSAERLKRVVRIQTTLREVGKRLQLSEAAYVLSVRYNV
jgi:hypothetical protein